MPSDKRVCRIAYYKSGPELESAKGHELPPYHLVEAWSVDNHPTHRQADVIGLFLPGSVTTSGGNFMGAMLAKIITTASLAHIVHLLKMTFHAFELR